MVSTKIEYNGKEYDFLYGAPLDVKTDLRENQGYFLSASTPKDLGAIKAMKEGYIFGNRIAMVMLGWSDPVVVDTKEYAANPKSFISLGAIPVEGSSDPESGTIACKTEDIKKAAKEGRELVRIPLESNKSRVIKMAIHSRSVDGSNGLLSLQQSIAAMAWASDQDPVQALQECLDQKIFVATIVNSGNEANTFHIEWTTRAPKSDFEKAALQMGTMLRQMDYPATSHRWLDSQAAQSEQDNAVTPPAITGNGNAPQLTGAK
jgi:hypothetical protein